MWCRPEPSSVSPIYIPGRLRTASKPLRTLMESAPYSSGAGALSAMWKPACSGCGFIPVQHGNVTPCPPDLGGGHGNHHSHKDQQATRHHIDPSQTLGRGEFAASAVDKIGKCRIPDERNRHGHECD